MSLKLKICVKPLGNCSGFVFTDKTGAYGLDNLTGWGAPNEDIFNATSAVVYITFPGTNTEVAVDIFGDFPSDTNDSIDILTSNSIPQFMDGLYKFRYVVTVGETEYVVVEEYYNLCNSLCCLDKKLAKSVEIQDCNCKCKDAEETMEIQTLIELTKAAACNRNFAQADCLLERIKKLCKGCGCGC